MRHPLIDILIARRTAWRWSKGKLADKAGLCLGSLYIRERSGRWRDMEVLERWCNALGYRLSIAKINEGDGDTRCLYCGCTCGR